MNNSVGDFAKNLKDVHTNFDLKILKESQTYLLKILQIHIDKVFMQAIHPDADPSFLPTQSYQVKDKIPPLLKDTMSLAKKLQKDLKKGISEED